MRRWRATVSGGLRAHRDERGAVLAEFALVAPVLLMLLFGIIQFGLAYHRAQAVEAAAHDAGRLASLSTSSTNDVVSRATGVLAGTIGGTTPTVVVSPGACAGRQGQSVTVTVSVPHRISVPFALEEDVVLTGRAVFRCEA